VAGPILFLGRADSAVLAFLRETEGDVVALEPWEEITPELLDREPRMAVSHGYKLIIRRPVIDRLPDRIVNLHISYLPWNRGIEPNLWSFLEDTPQGVTIHYVDPGVDTGDIIAQRRLEFSDDETLVTSYAALQVAIADLFREQWPAILAGTCDRRPQRGEGSVHTYADREAVDHLLTAGYDTRVGELRGRLSTASGRRPR
jgi:methionyl-tRNA formyltransferase